MAGAASAAGKPAVLKSASIRSDTRTRFGPRCAGPTWPSTEATQGWRRAIARRPCPLRETASRHSAALAAPGTSSSP